MSNQFGHRLFSIFFKTYTEKVWGMDCNEISADWAAQRIKGLSLAAAIRNAVFPQRKPKDRSQVIKTLIDTFRYPRRRSRNDVGTLRGGGPGNGRKGRDGATRNRLPLRLRKPRLDRHRHGPGWQNEKFSSEHVISSMPIRELGAIVEPAFSDAARTASQSLRYRDFVTVGLILEDRNLFADNWIYIHDPKVKVGPHSELQILVARNGPRSEILLLRPGVFLLRRRPTVEHARRGTDRPGQARIGNNRAGVPPVRVTDGCVIRQSKAYPVYDDDYSEHVAVVRDEIEARFPGLHLVGRNGMHKYNNQDHAMMTAMLTASNIIVGGRQLRRLASESGRRVSRIGRRRRIKNGPDARPLAALRAVPIMAIRKSKMNRDRRERLISRREKEPN